MTRAELNAELREVQLRLIACEHQADGVKKLFDAATIMGNGTLSETYRQQMHDLLDFKLDTTAHMMQLTRDLIDLGQ